MLPFNYNFGLYRRNNFGEPCVWYAAPFDDNSIEVYHGIVGKTINRDIIVVGRTPRDEISSRIKAKEKIGYKRIWEVKDNNESPVEEQLYKWLATYLPYNRTTVDGTLLPMLAKVYDNTNNRIFKKETIYFGQYKINGLRCFISAYRNNNDMFKPIRLRFQSREGTYWNSLSYLEDYLLIILDDKLLDKMIDECYCLDGEIYLPGHTVNEINHFVKDPNCPENKLLQYWCYDIAIEDIPQYKRLDILNNSCIGSFRKVFKTKQEHLNNTERLIVLPNISVASDYVATTARDLCIDLGFEGLIMRNPDAEYQYGKRNSAMIKYKKATDGKFLILDIYPEGVKRSNIPLFKCKNDINDEVFECHVGGSHVHQEFVLKHKEKFIGKYMYVEYGERSGVNQVPFHIKKTYII